MKYFWKSMDQDDQNEEIMLLEKAANVLQDYADTYAGGSAEPLANEIQGFVRLCMQKVRE